VRKLIWWNGVVMPSDEARIAVTSETAQRGVNAFEGLRAYWRAQKVSFAIVSTGDHLARLRQSLRLLRLPAEQMVDALQAGIVELTRAVETRQDLYLRPTIYLESGSYTSDPSRCVFGSFISCAEAPASPPVSCLVSSYRRVPADAFPPTAKSGASYAIFRLARIEAASAGCDEAILLDRHDNVTETGGASIFVVRDGSVITPPHEDGILESITRRHAVRILRERLGIKVLERSVPVQELLDADELFLTGTLDEVRLVKRLHAGRRPLSHTIGSAVRDEYLSMCRDGWTPLDDSMFTEVRT
jgi:branched-chain amino acid aminotransferase